MKAAEKTENDFERGEDFTARSELIPAIEASNLYQGLPKAFLLLNLILLMFCEMLNLVATLGTIVTQVFSGLLPGSSSGFKSSTEILCFALC